MSTRLPVTFYFDGAELPTAPSTIPEFIQWQRQLALQERSLGPASWTVQSFVMLKANGVDCHLSSRIPAHGIIIAHYDDLPKDIPTDPNRYWVCLLADRFHPHPYAQFHVLQNPTQRLLGFQPGVYMPHWPQPGLVPRDIARGVHVRNVRFFGEHYGLNPELASRAFSDWCSDHGMDFRCVPRERWHDYAECDAVIASRSFNDRSWFHNKPATKLVNAWLAHTPAILGRESAYRIEGHVGKDYLEAVSIADVHRHLLALRDNPDLVRDLVANGCGQIVRLSSDALVSRWKILLESEIIPRAMRWSTSNRARISAFRTAGRIRAGLAWRGILIRSDFRA